MTYSERLNKALYSEDARDELDKLLMYAYYRGRETATRSLSDKYSAQMRGVREKASKMRYRWSTLSILPGQDYIYSGDYAGDYSATFGGDEYTGA